MSTITKIRQSEIPGGPPLAVVRNYSLGEIAQMEAEFRAALPSVPPFAVGVSIKLAPVGPKIHTLALATQNQVFCLTFQQPPSRAQKVTLRKLLEVQYLTGFELPYTITLLAHALGSEVSGYDLSTLKDMSISTPGDFLHQKNVSVTARSINERWDGGILSRIDANSTGEPEPDYALRAWLSAMYVTLIPLSYFLTLQPRRSAAKMAIQELPLGQRLSTQFIDAHVRPHRSIGVAMLIHLSIPCRRFELTPT
jgi:hypothetical protein